MVHPFPWDAVPRRLLTPEPTLKAFLTDLAVQGNVAAATQSQAMNALVFLDTRVINHVIENRVHAVRAAKKLNVPVVMSRDEVAAVRSPLDGSAQLVAIRRYGNGLRRMEAVRLRIQDRDVPRKPRTVR